MFFVPVRALLVRSSSLNDGDVVARLGDKLEAHGQTLFSEAAGDGKRRKSAEIADSTEGIGKREISFKIGGQRSCGNRLGGIHQDIERAKYRIHLVLENFTNFEGL